MESHPDWALQFYVAGVGADAGGCVCVAAELGDAACAANDNNSRVVSVSAAAAAARAWVLSCECVVVCVLYVCTWSTQLHSHTGHTVRQSQMSHRHTITMSQCHNVTHAVTQSHSHTAMHLGLFPPRRVIFLAFVLLMLYLRVCFIGGGGGVGGIGGIGGIGILKM